MSVIPSYDAEQLADLLAILPDVDAVELKLTVPDDRQRSVVHALGIDPLDAVVRQLAFVDTPALELSTAGVVVRARRTQRKPGDVTVKLRPMLPDEAPAKLRGADGFKVELDASPAGFTCSCSLTAEVPDRKVHELMSGDRTLGDALGAAQRELVHEKAPGGVDLAGVVALGPINLLKAKFQPEGYPRRMVAELWVMPDGGRVLELSTKATPAEAFQAAAETKVFLAGKGIDLGAPQELKTATALAALLAERQG